MTGYRNYNSNNDDDVLKLILISLFDQMAKFSLNAK